MSWTKEKIYTKASEIKDYLGLTEEEEKQMQVILERFPMSVPDYYLSLIDKNDPADPIRRMCIPSLTETDLSGDFDTSGEADNTVQTGLQHKYTQTALVLSTNCCSMYCRHCFRKRLVGVDNTETAKQFDSMMQYIEEHKELTNVLVSGGDSLMLPNHMIRKYLQRLTAMEHLDLIRFGTRIPVVFPDRVLKDPELQEIFREYADKKQIYIVTQFNHPKELTPQAKEVIRIFRKMGIIVKNQTVLLKGVNDDPKVLGQLLRDLTAAGVVPYYIFQCRPVRGVKNQFQVPLEKGVRIVDEAKNMQNGQGKCIRYCMSTPRGKIEVLGQLPDGKMLFKFNQAKDSADAGRIMMLDLEPGQCWLS
ncbi:MAG TPA: KamA family radical SAM protein [Candidatus Blautia faecipullorum]|nr:KamA family radical SAM protein [Candidatus Blautia faecipullorum]